MREEIYEIITDADGVDCYIKRGEIVRCKDCKYWERKGLDYGMCKKVDPDTIRMTSEDAYCSEGERKERKK